MKIYLASDHAGLELKNAVKEHLEKEEYEIEDLGAHDFDPADDYPDYIIPAAKAVSKNPEKDRAIIFGYSGQGEAMAANRHKGVRAAVFYGGPAGKIIKLSREHNNANILSLGAVFVGKEEALAAVSLWLETKFSGEERHLRRISKFN